MSKSGKLTPMLRHYLEVKEAHRDAILLYRMGDFYEMFFEDAIEAAPLLEISLTARGKGTANEAPMCGVPHHALEGYLGKLLRAGRKVAICDQVEDPKEAKGLVKREVTRVVTPGTVSEPGLLEGKEESLLAAMAFDGAEGGGAFLEVSTGRFFVRRWKSAEAAREDLRILRPREVVHVESAIPELLLDWMGREGLCRTPVSEDRFFSSGKAAELLCSQFRVKTLRGFGIESGEAITRAAALALGYARDTQRNELGHVRTLSLQAPDASLLLDATTLANLEIFRSQREGGSRGTLLSVFDHCATTPGGRLLREWLQRPLRSEPAIESRLDAVEELAGDHDLRQRLREHLASIGDPERLAARAVLGSLTPREAAALRDGLAILPRLFAEVAEASSGLLRELGETDRRTELHAELARTLAESPPAAIKDGGVVAEGFHAELDECRSLARDTKRHILAMEAQEREATGIGSLKIRYNRVFGYYLEVTKANQHLVPDHYIRKQTLVNAERFVTPEVKELEEKVLGAEERQLALEEEIFGSLRGGIAAEAAGIKEASRAVATLDVLLDFAEQASRHRYVRPKILSPGGEIRIREGRHPVVERARKVDFVPNDTDLDPGQEQIVVLTGPNMGGKSTYLRQVALIVLLAQVGSFVPADSAEIGLCDRIFTRVGASDDLARGESTFMVEMIETANILHNATSESLVILDEVGRGTATFDGLSLAWAIVEHLHEHARPRTLFATHYHELTELSALLDRVVNRTLSVKEWEGRIVFLHRVVAGSADKSYGLHVARLAGVPEPVVQRAEQVLDNLEKEEYDHEGRPRRARGGGPEPPPEAQLQLFTPPEEMVARLIRDTAIEELTPLAALNLLHSLRERLGGG